MLNPFYLLLITFLYAIIVACIIFGIAKLFKMRSSYKTDFIAALFLCSNNILKYYIFSSISINRYITDVIGISLLFAFIYILDKYYSFTFAKGLIFIVTILILSALVRTLFIDPIIL